MDTLLGVSIGTWIEMKVEAERRGYSVEEFVIKLQSYTYSVRSDDSFMPRKEVSFDEWNW